MDPPSAPQATAPSPSSSLSSSSPSSSSSLSLPASSQRSPTTREEEDGGGGGGGGGGGDFANATNTTTNKHVNSSNTYTNTTTHTAAVPRPAMKRLGRDIEYSTDEPVGRGAFGAVYRGYSRRHRRPVAIKRFRPISPCGSSAVTGGGGGRPPSGATSSTNTSGGGGGGGGGRRGPLPPPPEVEVLTHLRQFKCPNILQLYSTFEHKGRPGHAGINNPSNGNMAGSTDSTDTTTPSGSRPGGRRPHHHNHSGGGGREFIIVTELCTGGDLKELLDFEWATISPVAARSLIYQLCNALLVLRRNGIIHRDVKPANILLIAAAGNGTDDKSNITTATGDGNRNNISDDSNRDGPAGRRLDPESAVLKLADFGMAKIAQSHRERMQQQQQQQGRGRRTTTTATPAAGVAGGNTTRAPGGGDQFLDDDDDDDLIAYGGGGYSAVNSGGSPSSGSGGGGMMRPVQSALFLSVMGTHMYMSPERIRKQLYSYNADVYSAGMVLYELMTRRHVPARSERDLLSAVPRAIEALKKKYSISTPGDGSSGGGGGTQPLPSSSPTPPPTTLPLWLDLLCGMTAAKPSERLTIEEVLSHRWFTPENGPPLPPLTVPLVAPPGTSPTTRRPGSVTPTPTPSPPTAAAAATTVLPSAPPPDDNDDSDANTRHSPVMPSTATAAAAAAAATVTDTAARLQLSPSLCRVTAHIGANDPPWWTVLCASCGPGVPPPLSSPPSFPAACGPHVVTYAVRNYVDSVLAYCLDVWGTDATTTTTTTAVGGCGGCGDSRARSRRRGGTMRSRSSNAPCGGGGGGGGACIDDSDDGHDNDAESDAAVTQRLTVLVFLVELLETGYASYQNEIQIHGNFNPNNTTTTTTGRDAVGLPPSPFALPSPTPPSSLLAPSDGDEAIEADHCDNSSNVNENTLIDAVSASRGYSRALQPVWARLFARVQSLADGHRKLLPTEQAQSAAAWRHRLLRLASQGGGSGDSPIMTAASADGCQTPSPHTSPPLLPRASGGGAGLDRGRALESASRRGDGRLADHPRPEAALMAWAVSHVEAAVVEEAMRAAAGEAGLSETVTGDGGPPAQQEQRQEEPSGFGKALALLRVLQQRTVLTAGEMGLISNNSNSTAAAVERCFLVQVPILFLPSAHAHRLGPSAAHHLADRLTSYLASSASSSSRLAPPVASIRISAPEKSPTMY